MSSTISKTVCKYSGVPVCAVSPDGIVQAASHDIDEVFLYHKIEGSSIFTLTAIKYSVFVEAAEGGSLPLLERNGKKFKMVVRKMNDKTGILIFFLDVTNFESLKNLYNKERICMALVHVDNYDELVSIAGESGVSHLGNEIDKRIRKWTCNMNASCTRYKDDLYFVVMSYKNYSCMEESRFPILDEIREVVTEADFPVTLSIGIGLQGNSTQELDQAAQDALDMALGRGGDQVVVKHGQTFSYYGGRAKAVEKNNKGKSRIFLYAYIKLVQTASNVLIMGHKKPDMDSFGACLGMSRITKMAGKEPYIILGEYNETINEVVERAVEAEEYNFVSPENGLEIMDENTLVVFVDNHRLSMADAPDVIENAGKLVLIDHHRRAEDMLDATLINIEPYASSTSELVTEMLQFANGKKQVTNLEADALLGGMTVDTNRFTVQTGVRTFEAASWLRRAGADTATVKRFFRIDRDSFKLRADTIAGAVIENGIATGICKTPHVDAQVIDSQVADELITIKDVKASFVAGIDLSGQTVISARSLGDINVQTIMEKMGGGGRFMTAGAQTDMTPEEAIDEIKRILSEEENI